MNLTEHTLVFVQEMAGEDNNPAGTGVSWEVRTSEHTGKKKQGLQRIFIVPVCSTFSLDTISYHRFLEESGALDQARRLLEEGNLHTADGAIITRKKVQSCIIAAEVDSILVRRSLAIRLQKSRPYPILSLLPALQAVSSFLSLARWLFPLLKGNLMVSCIAQPDLPFPASLKPLLNSSSKLTLQYSNSAGSGIQKTMETSRRLSLREDFCH